MIFFSSLYLRFSIEGFSMLLKLNNQGIIIKKNIPSPSMIHNYSQYSEYYQEIRYAGQFAKVLQNILKKNRFIV